MRRHASADELASYAAGAMRPRKAAKVASHLSGCAQCAQVSSELENVSTMLASVSFAPMPDSVSVRIEAALATESSQRLASAPATEAGRRDLPARAGGGGRSGWKLPRFNSPLAVRLVAAAGAAVVVVGGAYELASHGLGSSSSASPSAARRAAPGVGAASLPQLQNLSYGAEINVGPRSHLRPMRTVTSTANFVPAGLQTEVDAVMTQANKAGLQKQNSVAGGHSLPSAEYSGVNVPGTSSKTSQLQGCVDRISAGLVPALVDRAKFEGKAATIIILAARGTSPAQFWAVGTSCSASVGDVLYHQVLKHV